MDDKAKANEVMAQHLVTGDLLNSLQIELVVRARLAERGDFLLAQAGDFFGLYFHHNLGHHTEQRLELYAGDRG